MEDLTGYKLSRQWFDFCFENPEMIRPVHTAIYMFAIEHWNRLGQKRKFGFPSQMTMDAIGVKSYNTYSPAFQDLVDWGFFDLIEKSTNQYSANIIALSKIDKAPDKALDKAFIKHHSKHQSASSNFDKAPDEAPDKAPAEHLMNQRESSYHSKCSIDKQINNRTIEQENKEQGSSLAPQKFDWFEKDTGGEDLTLQARELHVYHRAMMEDADMLHEFDRDDVRQQEIREFRMLLDREGEQYTMENVKHVLQTVFKDPDYDKDNFKKRLFKNAKKVREHYNDTINEIRLTDSSLQAQRGVDAHHKLNQKYWGANSQAG